MAALTTFLRSSKQASKCGIGPRLLQASTIIRQHHDHGEATGKNLPDHKFYELRTYKVTPALFPEFIKLTNENIFPRLSHSKLIGYWVTDIGGLNEVFHIWEYDCFAQRTAVRAALAKDEVWQSSYFSKAVQMLQAQENASARLLPWKPLQDKPLKEGGIYEFRQYVLKPGGAENLKARIMARDEFYSSMGCGKLMGAWTGDIGHANKFYALWNFESADKRLETRSAVLESDAFKKIPPSEALTPEMYSKIMVPTPFSTLK